jgi:DNA primase
MKAETLELTSPTLDLLTPVEEVHPLKRVASTGGGEYAGSCPFCGGKDRFRVWPNEGRGGRYWCRQCQSNGDGIEFLRDFYKTSYQEARRFLAVNTTHKIDTGKSVLASPPKSAWQQRARRFVEAREESLWSATNKRALNWLRDRGLKDDTIRYARLGYNRCDRREDLRAWGLDYEKDKKTIWLPEGIVIPFEMGEDLWKIQIRSYRWRDSREKYYCVKGSKNGLHGADKIIEGKPVILVEGIFDALSLVQEAGDLIIPVAPGSTTGGRREPWIGLLTSAPFVLVSFDADEAGDTASRHWLAKLPNAVWWRPFWDDPSQMLMDGADLRSWVGAGVQHATR